MHSRIARGSLLATIACVPTIVTSSLGGCSTDNASALHGPHIGDLPRRDADTIDGKVVLPDGAIVDPESDAGEEGEAAVPCTKGTVAVLAGNDASLSGAIQEKNGAWVAATIAGGAARSRPALVAFGSGFLGVTHGPGEVLQSTTYAGASWSAATALGRSGVKGAPSLAVAGSKAHVVYAAGEGTERFFFHDVHDGAVWEQPTKPVKGSDAQSFGTVSAGLAASGNEVVFAENGTNNGLYVRTFGTAWSEASAVLGAGTIGGETSATPEMVAVEGELDVVLVYSEKTTRRLSFATRGAASNTWTNGGNVQLHATTDERPALARIDSTTLLLAFRGQDGNAYYARGTIGGQNVSWTAASPIGGGAAFSVDSAPVVARGVCGDDAIFAHASGGTVRVTRLRGTTWTDPETIPGLSGSRVAIATR
jgi:hypothetical protein